MNYLIEMIHHSTQTHSPLPHVFKPQQKQYRSWEHPSELLQVIIMVVIKPALTCASPPV